MTAPSPNHAARAATLVTFQLNGEPVTVAAPPHWTLVEVLRYQLNLTGTKQGCDKGDCGACTVRVDGAPVLACMTLAVLVQGRSVETVEGLGVGGEPHPLQRTFAELGAAQCGFCTPGMLMSASAYLDDLATRDAPTVDAVEISAVLGGNLCRCTGYTKIVQAVAVAAREVVERAQTLAEMSNDEAML